MHFVFNMINRGDLITILAGACEDNYSVLNDAQQSHTYYPTVSYEEVSSVLKSKYYL